MSYIPLQSRSVIALYGPDTRSCLQGIITNDINKLDNQKAIYSLLLNFQGKYLYDFFLIKYKKYVLIECESIYSQQIIEKINLLKTYLRVKIKDVSPFYKVGVLFKTTNNVTELVKEESQIIFQDPRHRLLGMRIIHKEKIDDGSTMDFAQYERIRIQNLIPDGTKDMIQNSSFPLQYLIDKANGISFDKGCYIGQETISRMSRQKVLRKRLYFVEGDRMLPHIGTLIVNEKDEEIGELRSSIDNIGLALLYSGRSYISLYAGRVRIVIKHSDK